LHKVSVADSIEPVAVLPDSVIALDAGRLRELASWIDELSRRTEGRGSV
jgi:hypothetical protein